MQRKVLLTYTVEFEASLDTLNIIDKSTGKPITPEERYCLKSMSKSALAAAMATYYRIEMKGDLPRPPLTAEVRISPNDRPYIADRVFTDLVNIRRLLQQQRLQAQEHNNEKN